MSHLKLGETALGTQQWGPWTDAGGPDPDFDEGVRVTRYALLTDANLLTCFRRRFHENADAGYDEIVRLLDYVWDCPHDGTANVTGHRCARCKRTRAQALSADRARRVTPAAARSARGHQPDTETSSNGTHDA